MVRGNPGDLGVKEVEIIVGLLVGPWKSLPRKVVIFCDSKFK